MIVCDVQLLVQVKPNLLVGQAWFKATAVGSSTDRKPQLRTSDSQEQAAVAASDYSCQVRLPQIVHAGHSATWFQQHVHALLFMCSQCLLFKMQKYVTLYIGLAHQTCSNLQSGVCSTVLHAELRQDLCPDRDGLTGRLSRACTAVWCWHCPC